MLRKSITILLFTFILSQVLGQTSTIKLWQDSLALPSLSDTTKIKLYKKIANAYLDTNYHKAIETYQKIVDIYNESDNDKEQIKTLQIISDIYLQNNNRNESIRQLERALSIAKNIDNDTIIGDLYKSLGYTCELKSDYENAIKYYLKSLTYKEKLNDIKGQASNYNSIGLIYYYQRNYQQSLDNLKKALKLVKKIDFKFGIASILTNIANIYMERDNNKVDSINIAIDYYRQALDIDHKIDDKYAIASTLHNIGVSHATKITSLSEKIDKLQFQKDTVPDTEKLLKDSLNELIDQYKTTIDAEIDTTLSYFFKSIDIKKSIADSANLAITYLNIAALKNKPQKKFKEALQYLKLAKEIAKKFELNKLLVDIYNEMSFTYSNLNNYKKAYEYKVSYDELKDSLSAQDLNKTLAELQEKYENDKKEKEIALQRSKIKQQTTFQTALIIFILLLIILAFVVLRGYQNKRKANLLLEERNKQIELQKAEIEIKNKDIMDSINYARRIQQAILPPSEIISRIFPDYFILFKPKDIVSGDFYWIEKKKERRLATVVDCTGHGVPGAFMSIIGANSLNKTINDLRFYHPGDILNQVSILVEEILRQKGKTNIRDGMDMSLIMLDTEKQIAEFSGANNPLYIIRKKGHKMIVNGKEKLPVIENETHNLFEIKGDKQPIGAVENRQSFTNHVFTIEKGDRFYLFSDGYADQFGGPKNKKLKYKPFKQILLNISLQNIEENKTFLDKYFEEWKGQNSQIDDVCVMGIAYE